MINPVETLERTGSFVPAEPPNVNDIPDDPDLRQDQASDATERVLVRIMERSQRDASRFPMSARSQVNWATSLVNLQRFEEAKRVLSRALELEAHNYLARLTLARCHMELSELSQARKVLEGIVEEHPDDQAALVLLSLVLARSARLDQAIECARRAVVSDARKPWPHFHLALYLLRAGNTNEAIANLKQAVRILPHSPVLQHALGVAYAIGHQSDRAKRQFQIALGLSPGMSDAIKGLSKVLTEDKRADAVVELLLEHLGRVPHDLEARELLAAAYFRRQEYKNCRRQLFKALYEMPETVVAPAVKARLANNLGVCYEHLADIKKAEGLFRSAITWHSEAVPVAYTNLARVLLRTKRAPDARKVLDQDLALFPADPTARHLLAAALVETAETERSIEVLRGLIADGQAQRDTYGLLSYLLGERQQDRNQAIEVLRAAVDKYPRDAMLLNSLAYTYLMNDQADEARAILRDLVGEGQAAVYVAATKGLLKLLDHDIQAGRDGYEEAIRLARVQGNERLALLAQQKMHLELARAYLRQEWFAMAHREIESGLEMGEELNEDYLRDLRGLEVSLRPAPRDV